ncbi:outer membrane protein assembly factor [Alteromonas sp. 5E99-2]|uniref:outer membrane protein assembly factor n=1 Tax=Alteromonas sp. 5E99-2 TaxID=2817683 RepID=UPI001A990685|nr:outer membrane protein assembly factor [Alteromonas sp. 5E99-2]MBO1256858.1 outer membrane protein assembly factor [Alteromonas sp. 5E99-2]
MHIQHVVRLSLVLFLSNYAHGETQLKNDCKPSNLESFHVDKIDIKAQTIFDETAKNTLNIHRWANKLHINTREFVIAERLPFQQGDSVNLSDLGEAEALLRGQSYIANAAITVLGICNAKEPNEIKVETQDNWTLFPAFSLSRTGGRTSSLIGVSDANFLGLGIGARVRYTQDEQRSGYQVSFSSAVHWIRHANVRLTLANNDDGNQYRFTFDKPFYHLGTNTRQFLQVNSDERTQDIFQNDKTRNSLNTRTRFFRGAYGWRLHSNELNSSRLTVGFDSSNTEFEFDETSPSFNPLFLPENRNYRYPWVSYEYLQRNIVVMHDVHLIKQPEDINLGWRYRVQLGLETNDVRENSDLGYHINASANRAFKIENWLLLLDSRFNAILNTSAKDFIRSSNKVEIFYRKNRALGYYGRVSADFSTGQFIDRPLVIDDDNGVRGYPLQYQHGDHRISASAEARFYTNYNIYQFFELGFATFIDAGRAYQGELSAFNEDDGVLGSIGLGARFYSNKATNTGVIHVDLTFPLTNGEGVDTLAWSAQLRRSF